MKKGILLFSCLLFTFCCYSQRRLTDYISLKNGEKFDCQITEIKENSLEYKDSKKKDAELKEISLEEVSFFADEYKSYVVTTEGENIKLENKKYTFWRAGNKLGSTVKYQYMAFTSGIIWTGSLYLLVVYPPSLALQIFSTVAGVVWINSSFKVIEGIDQTSKFLKRLD